MFCCHSVLEQVNLSEKMNIPEEKKNLFFHCCSKNKLDSYQKHHLPISSCFLVPTMSRYFSKAEVTFQELAGNGFAAMVSFLHSAPEKADYEREVFSQVLLSSEHYEGIHVEIKKLATLRDISLESSPSKTENPLISPRI